MRSLQRLVAVATIAAVSLAPAVARAQSFALDPPSNTLALLGVGPSNVLIPAGPAGPGPLPLPVVGFSTADQARPCSEFSGGWRMRVALAATLFSAPDLLLLDEPTNYLDLEGTLWLGDHLANYPRTVIVISHDRDLLEASVDQILHLDRGKLTLYKGTYSSFEEQRATREMLDAKHASRQADER